MRSVANLLQRSLDCESRLSEQQGMAIVRNAEPKGDLALADLIRDLAYAEEARKKLY
jgi:hypothetical protein